MESPWSANQCRPGGSAVFAMSGRIRSSWRTRAYECHNDRMINPSDIDLFDLLGRWRGAGRLPTAQPEDLPLGLPVPLVEWYRITSGWPEVRSAGTKIYEPSSVRVGVDRVPFMEDLTGDWVWVFDPSQSNVVYEGDPGGRLSESPEGLAELLLHATMRSIILLSGSSRLGAQVPDVELPRILDGLKRVGFGGWKWPRPGYRLFVSDNLLAEVGPAVDPAAPWLSRPEYSAVRIAGLSGCDLSYLDSFATVSWIDTGFDGE